MIKLKDQEKKRIEGDWIHKDDEIQINGVVIDLSKFLNQEWNYLQIKSDQIIPTKQDYIDSEPEYSWSKDYDIEKKSEHKHILNLKEE